MIADTGTIIDSSPEPEDKNEELEKGFELTIVEQPKLLDELGKQLLALSLAVPGLFATVLKLTSGDQAVMHLNPLVLWAFLCWFLALIFCLVSLTPRKWQVDRQIVRRQKPAAKRQPLSIEEFFMKSALYKRRLLVAASLFCFLGIFLASISIFNNPIIPIKP